MDRFRTPPPLWLGWLLAVGLMALWGLIRLYVFRAEIFPLTFVIPLLLCVWTLDRRMLWSMAVVFLVMISLEYYAILPGATSPERATLWAAAVINIVVGAGVIHLIVNLRRGVLATLRQLEQAHDEISTQNQELEAQSEELAQQNEELAQQQEELTQKTEELEVQNEELQVQSEEVQVLNTELDQREGLLQTLLDATRLHASEESVLQDIAAAAVDIVGEPKGLVVVCEQQAEGFAVRAAVDEDGGPVPLGEAVCPVAMSELVLQEQRTGALADASLRPDLTPAAPPDRPPFQALLTAPFVGGGNRGTITVLTQEKRQWTTEQFRLMEWLAAQAGRILESLRLQGALRESEERFRLIADELPFMIWVVDTSGALSFVNRRYCEFFGVTPDKVQGNVCQARVHPDDAALFLGGLREALQAQAPFRGRVRLRNVRGEWRWVETVAVPRFAADGGYLGMLGSSPDVTDSVYAEQVLRDNARRAEVLTSIDALVHSRLEINEILEDALGRAARALSCQAVHVLRLDHDGQWHAQQAWNEPTVKVPADLVALNARLAENARASWEALGVSASGSQPEVTPFAENLPGRASLAVPLIARDSFLGLITCHRFRDPLPFDAGQVEFARRLAASISLAIENARLYEEQRQIAVTLQENFIHPLPQVPSVEFAVVAQAAGSVELIGGDFHDAFQLPGGLVAILIGDVSGKGVRASGLGETVRSAVRALTLVSPSAATVLTHVNRLLLADDSDSFVSLLLMLIDTQTASVEVASAGHPAPVHLRDGAARLVSLAPGPPLGAVAWEYEASRLELAPADVLVAFTDGLIEARNHGRLFGEQRVVELVQEIGGDDLAKLPEGLRGAAVRFAGKVQDDLQVLAVRYLGPGAKDGHGPEPVLRLTLPHVVAHLRDIRAAVRDFLSDGGVDEQTRARVILCAEEACTNTICHSHSRTSALLEVRISEHAVEARVVDAGRGIDVKSIDLERPPDLLSEGRRGLYLIKHYSDELEISNDGGAVVRFSVRRPLAVSPDMT